MDELPENNIEEQEDDEQSHDLGEAHLNLKDISKIRREKAPNSDGKTTAKKLKSRAEQAEKDLEYNAKSDELIRKQDIHKLYVTNLIQTLKQRKKYANRVYVLIFAWLVSIFALVLIAGTSSFFGICKFSLSDNVLLAMIGSTTLNVIGIFIIVMKHLFPNINSNVINKEPDSQN